MNIGDCRNLLEEYGYRVTDNGLNEILKTWESNKKDIIDHFRKHPAWDEDALAIILKNDYERKFNKEALKIFYYWAERIIEKIKHKNIIKIESYYDKNIDIENMIKNINYIKKIMKHHGEDEIIKIDKYEISMYLEGMKKELKHEEDKFLENYDTISRADGEYINKNLNRKLINAKAALYYIKEKAESNILTEELANVITNRCEVRAVAGEKLSRVINKICKTIDLDKYEEISVTGRKIGYNHHYAIMSNDINPIKYKRITVISVNPLDYWTMSFGKKWASCHTIDKNNKRNCGNNYQGCYSSGTESYMLDSSSIIYYVIDEEYEGNDYWAQDKINRCVFCLNESKDLILESRVYPDGRDGGDETLAGQFRNVMQKIVSELWEKNNYWTLEKGTSICKEKTVSCGTHYKDYKFYEDCNISTNKDYDEPKKIIYIGHDPICPNCGYEHTSEENIVCEECRMVERCDRCDEIIDMDEAININGNIYCCEDCARNDGYELCYDDDEWYDSDDLTLCEDGHYHLNENCYQDEYDYEYYYGEPEIITEDGSKFSCEYNAIEKGYQKDYFSGSWYKEEEFIYDNFYEEYFIAEEGIITADGNIYINEESAKYHGYIKNEMNEWVKEEVA